MELEPDAHRKIHFIFRLQDLEFSVKKFIEKLMDLKQSAKLQFNSNPNIPSPINLSMVYYDFSLT